MIKELIEYMLSTAYKHQSINYVGYKRKINTNDSHNTKSFQFIIENDTPYIEKQIVEGIITMKFSLDIIGYVGTSASTLSVQDEALHIGLDWMEYINNDYTYPLEIRDYSILALTEYTDDNSSGVRMTVQLIIPNPINLCEYSEHFIEKTTPVIDELDISDGDECTNEHFVTGSTLTLNPIKLN